MTNSNGQTTVEAIAMERLLTNWKLPAEDRKTFTAWGKTDSELDRLASESHPNFIRRKVQQARDAFAASGDPADFAKIRPIEDEAHRRLAGCQKNLDQLRDARRTGAQRLLPRIRELHEEIATALKGVHESEFAVTTSRCERYGIVPRHGPIEESIRQTMTDLDFSLRYVQADCDSERVRSWLALVGIEVEPLVVVP